MSKIILINTTEPPVKNIHITYSIREDTRNIMLDEISDMFYPHSNSDGCAIISRIETNNLSCYNKNDIKAAPLLLLKNALDNISLLLKNKEK